MITDTSIGAFDLLIFLGICLGILLSWFMIRNGLKSQRYNLYQGLLLLLLSFTMLEELLNNTGYITHILAVSNFSEPFNFAFGPLVFLYVRSLLEPDQKKKAWPHLLLLGFWILYMLPYFVQSDLYKYNSYVECKHPGWPFLDVSERIIDSDPLGIRGYINVLTGIHMCGYLLAAAGLIARKLRETSQGFFRTGEPRLKLARNTVLHFFAIAVIFGIVKLSFHMDVGDYFISSYLSFMILCNTWQVIAGSSYFGQPRSFMEFPVPKYRKSSLDREEKQEIAGKIRRHMETERYYTTNLASLSGLAKEIREPVHHVSQVINEVLGHSFFELLAQYRVGEAKRLLLADDGKEKTIEEIAEEVGYNSKSSFNKVFKAHTGQTPSAFRSR